MTLSSHFQTTQHRSVAGTQVERRWWTTHERHRMIEMSRQSVEVRDMLPAFPGRTLASLTNYRARLVRQGVVERRIAAPFQRTPARDAAFALEVVSGMKLLALAAKWGRDPAEIHRWKQALGVKGPRDRNTNARLAEVSAHG